MNKGIKSRKGWMYSWRVKRRQDEFMERVKRRLGEFVDREAKWGQTYRIKPASCRLITFLCSYVDTRAYTLTHSAAPSPPPPHTHTD